jgi:TrpR-related protein YerC/YecD
MFFEDICTVGELNAIAQRLEVAKMLQKGCKYADISQKTGASAATISRVNRCLNYGADGYKMILERLDKENGEEKC